MRFSGTAAVALLCVSSLVAAVIPRQAPEYSIQLPNGRKVQLSQYRGKVIALEFILTSCQHCQETAQIMEKMQREFGAQGFQALGAALNEDAVKATPEFIRVLKLGFPVGVGSRDAAVDFLQHPIMTTMMMPQLVFIDRGGNIQAQFPGNHPFMLKNEEANIRALIKELLQGKTTPRPKPSAPAKKVS